MMHGVVIGLLAAAFASPQIGWAYNPLRDARKLSQPKVETVYRVETAKVVIADYDLLRRDFAELAKLSTADINDWLLDRVGYISEAQSKATLANTPVRLTGKTTQAFRPASYGRALVYQVGGGHGLIDGKGTGVAPDVSPYVTNAGHSDGLATLGESMREFMYEKLVRTVLAHAGSPFETLEHYAVVDWGFDVKHANGAQSPAGMILRQAHQRMETHASMLPDGQSRLIESTLRRYGLTSAGAHYGKYASDLINIQGTIDWALLDFGGYMAFEKFEHDAASFFSREILLGPSVGTFLQPDPNLRVSYKDWGFSRTGVPDPKMDNPWVYAHELADNYRAGIADRSAFKTQFEDLVGNYRRTILSIPSKAAKPGVLEALAKAMAQIK